MIIIHLRRDRTLSRLLHHIRDWIALGDALLTGLLTQLWPEP